MLLHYCNETWYAIYFDVSDVILNVVRRMRQMLMLLMNVNPLSTKDNFSNFENTCC